jgi:hypothetical protein
VELCELASHAGPRTARERVRDALAQLALFPKERLEVHRPLGRLDLAKQRVEVRAVFVHVDGVAFGGAAQRQPGEGGNEVLDGPVEIDTQPGIAMPLDRPDHDPEKDDDAEPDRKCHAEIIGPNF